MPNGFIIVKRENWKNATPEEREEMTFSTLESIDTRLKKLENRKWLNSGCSFKSLKDIDNLKPEVKNDKKDNNVTGNAVLDSLNSMFNNTGTGN